MARRRTTGRASTRWPTVLVIGAATRDIDTADPRGWRLGGGVVYGALAIARLGLQARALVGADEQAADARELDLLRHAGVDLRVVPLAHGPVFDNRYRPTGPRVQIAHQASDRLSVRSLTPDWRLADAVVLAPVAGELGPAWARVFSRGTLVGLAWQGLLRRLLPGQQVSPLPPRPLALIGRAELAHVSAGDVAAGGAPIRRLLRTPGQQLVITRGPLPALHVTRAGGERLSIRPLQIRPVGQPVDPTGAGDVFLATWAACVAAQARAGIKADPARAVAVAAAAAAAKVEASSLAEMPDLRELCDRLLRPPDALPPRR